MTEWSGAMILLFKERGAVLSEEDARNVGGDLFTQVETSS